MLGQQVENLGVQQLLDGVAIREIKDRVEKLEEAAQTVTISVPYISQDQYLEYPADPDLSQLLDVQSSEAQPDAAAFQDSKAGSTTSSEISDLLNCMRDTVSSAMPVPKMPDTPPQAKRRGQPAPQDRH